ncbi:hypothetical protein C8Q72DRAFT_891546 [Fomitopsis betulina]|nr:hypothetical protein C8Q72DRAFT_891546 [Fomitopsis betulina]
MFNTKLTALVLGACVYGVSAVPARAVTHTTTTTTLTQTISRDSLTTATSYTTVSPRQQRAKRGFNADGSWDGVYIGVGGIPVSGFFNGHPFAFNIPPDFLTPLITATTTVTEVLSTATGGSADVDHHAHFYHDPGELRENIVFKQGCVVDCIAESICDFFQRRVLVVLFQAVVQRLDNHYHGYVYRRGIYADVCCHDNDDDYGYVVDRYVVFSSFIVVGHFDRHVDVNGYLHRHCNYVDRHFDVGHDDDDDDDVHQHDVC